MPSRDWFHYYATRFNAVEINVTFYRPPSTAMLERWKKSVPEGFTFVLKASDVITHQARLVGCGDELAQMLREDSPLGSSLACILFQLPPSLRRNDKLLSRFLHQARKSLEGRCDHAPAGVRVPARLLERRRDAGSADRARDARWSSTT